MRLIFGVRNSELPLVRLLSGRDLFNIWGGALKMSALSSLADLQKSITPTSANEGMVESIKIGQAIRRETGLISRG